MKVSTHCPKERLSPRRTISKTFWSRASSLSLSFLRASCLSSVRVDSLILACRDLNAKRPKKPSRRRNTMPHELWPNRIFTADQLPSRSRVSSLCRPLRRGPPTAGVLLLGSVSDDGLRSVDLPRKPSRYRGVPSLPAGETLPPGLPRSRVSLDAGRCQRESRLAHLRRFCPSADRYCATVVCSRSNGRRSRVKSLRLGLHHDRSLPLAVSVGSIPQAQGRRQDAHAARPSRQYPHLYPRYRGQTARCEHPRRVPSRSRSILCDGPRLH